MARYQAIVLKKLPLREHDELVVCYTKHAGKTRYVAKGVALASSLQGSHLDVLNHVAFNLVEGKLYDIITSAVSISAFPALKSSLPALANAFFLLECFDKLVYDGERDEKLWNFLLEKLARSHDRVTESEMLSVMGHHARTRLSELTRGTIMSWQILP